MVLFSFVLTQFVEVSILNAGGFVLSLQKITVIAVFPLAILFMKRVRISLRFLWVALALTVASIAAYAASGDMANLLLALVSVGTGAIGAGVLYTTLTAEKGSLALFARTWVALAVVTAVLTLLQSIKLLPMWFVPADYAYMRETPLGLLRGVGLKFDPNFQALVLVIGLVFAQSYLGRGRPISTAIILIGILGTFSRMGLLGAVLALVLPQLIQLKKRRNFKALLRLALVAGTGVSILGLIYFWGPLPFREYANQRLVEAVAVIRNPNDFSIFGEQHLTSAQVRVLLARAAWTLALRNWYVGVGLNGSRDAIDSFLGINNVAHNTYLELLLVGGIWGVVTLLIYMGLIAGALNRTKNVVDDRDRAPVVSLLVIIGVTAMFLSLTNTSLIWLPLVMALSYEERFALWGRYR